MARKRIHVWISGRVQGVFFRGSVQTEATRRGLAGWVKNLPDGRVEAVFEGDAAQVEAMVAWCHFGVPMSRVDEVEAREEAPPVEELKEFNIRFGRWND